MKALLTLILIFAFGNFSIAQEVSEKSTEKISENKKTEVLITKKASENQKMTRVYLYKNSRVKKELKFKTKKNKSKLA